jgi:transcriptional regulator with XRE-family HTH domain
LYNHNGELMPGRPPNTAAATAKRAEIGGRLRQLRAALYGTGPFIPGRCVPGLTEFCARFKVTQRTWLNYELGTTMPPELILVLIIETGVSPRWLLTGDGEMFEVPLLESTRAALELGRASCNAVLAELDRVSREQENSGRS